MPDQAVDYAALAKKYGGEIEGQQKPAQGVDYLKLAQKFGGTVEGAQPTQKKQPQVPPVYTIGENIRGLKQRGNINVNDRPVVPNGKDSSTVLSMSIGTDQGEVLIPMVSDGADGKPPHIMGKDEAIQYYRKTKQHLGIFDNAADATRYAQQLHLQQAGLRNVNGRTVPTDHETLAAKHGGVVIRAHDPSLVEKARTAFESSYQGRTIENNVAQLGRGIKRLWSQSKNPLGMTDEAWAEGANRQHQFFTKMFDKAEKSQVMPKGTPEPIKNLSHKVYKTEAGAAEGTAQFGEELLSPQQLALMAGTFGESALSRGAAKLGIPGLVPASRVVSKLMQLQFLTQMVEGAGKNAKDAAQAAFKGDWQAAGQNAVQGLLSGIMAKTLLSHEQAEIQVRSKLDTASTELYPETQPKGIQRPFVSAFDQLDPHRQALVIDKVVRETPEYQSIVDGVEKQNESTREGMKRQQAQKLNRFYQRAISQSWDPNAATRTIRKLQAGRDRRASMDHAQQVREAVDAARAQYEETRKQAREARFQRRQETAAQRTAGAAEVGRVAANLAEKRDDIWKQRSELRESQAAIEEGPRREVETRADANGNITYPINYWGEENVFGVAGDLSGHSIYRQTPRGVEWLDANGNFEEEPEDIYAAPDPATADTIARITTLSVKADEIADSPSATAEQTREAEELAAIRREILGGEISTREAQRRAGIAEEVRLPDEYAAAAEGKLGGPFDGTSFGEYQRNLRRDAEDAGFPEEAVDNLMSEAGLLARQQTEDVLNHVYRAGDYIVGRNGTRWTLDSKGVLHSDTGEAAPLMKRGVYSSQAMQLAQSGRIGYGTETREERRVRAARERKVAADIAQHQIEVNREMRLAAQQEGLETAPENAPRGDVAAKGQREARRLSRPPRAPESPVGAIVRQIFKARSDENSVINAIANRTGTTPEDVMRLALASDPERSTTIEGQIARLEPGDTISDPFRKDRPWMVEDRGNGQMVLRSGNAAPLPLDRLNPSERVRRLVQEGHITYQKPEFAPGDVTRAAFEKPHYIDYQQRLANDVREKRPRPKTFTEKQVRVQAENAARRADAAAAVATRAMVNAVNPPADMGVEEAQKAVDKAEEDTKVAELAAAEAIESDAKTIPQDIFAPRAPATIGLRGNSGVITQNGREIPFHYELLPLGGVFTSHYWNGNVMVEEPSYDKELQPRTVSESESIQNALRAELRRVDDAGRVIGYNFAEYADPTISGQMGPAVVEEGGRAVGGNTRIAIMRRHLQNIDAIPDPEEREAYRNGFRAGMKKLADDSGILSYPNDGKDYVVVRMMDKPIETKREAAELGRLLNKPVSVQIKESARGVSYSKSLDQPVLADIARRAEANDGIGPAIQADPEFFRNIVIDRFGIVPEEYTNWFDEVPGRGLVLNETGRSQFEKALLGTAISDAAVLNRMEGKTAYRALSRALGYLVQMHAVPERDISGKIVEALNAAADTLNTDPQLSLSRDKWLATYHPDQQEFAGMETEVPPEPDRVTEALWRAMHASDAGTPRVLNDRLKSFMQDTSSAGAQLFGGQGAEGPAEAFNRAFSRELREVQHSRGDQTEGITEEEFKNALRNREMSDIEREESRKQPETPDVPAQSEAVEPKRLEPPPKAPTKESVASRDLAISKTETGYVTPDKLQEFLLAHPSTKDHVPELMRTAKIMAEYVYDADPPEGVARKDALDWVLRERLAGIESGELKSKAGQYRDPNIEKSWGERIMTLHQAANPSTFIHEFAHVIFPMLSDEDLKAIDTIAHKRGEGGVWDGTRKGLDPETYRKLSEKFAHGLEQFLRDENPTGFTHEVKQVLGKIKEIMRKVYLAFAGDPLSEYKNTEESREVFAKMFGITDFDVQDNWRDEVKQARAEEKRLKRPSEEAHPLTKMATEIGANHIQNSVAGKVEDSIGVRVDPRKPTAAFIFPDQAAALAAWDRISAPGGKVDNAELVQAEDGTWGIRLNTRAKLPGNILYQEVPRRHPALELEDMKKRLRETPESAPMLRKLLQIKVQNLENEIRARHGSPAEAVQDIAPAAKDALQEVKRGKEANAVREAAHGNAGIPPSERPRGIPRPPAAAKPTNAGTQLRGVREAGSRVAGVPNSLAEVKPVALQPLNAARGPSVGTVKGDAFDAHEWVDSLRRAGLPENLPPPTWALDRRTAEKLIFPGQKQVVQTALSALEVGDGAVVATATGTGKTYTALAITKEWRTAHPDARILHITKNAGLLKDAQKVSANTFGFDVEDKVPDVSAQPGVYGTTYARIIRDKAAMNTKWDLVLSDESGEARNWFMEENKQGKALMDITANAKKAVYFSATPFHSPMEYGYLNKLNLWPQNGFDRWIENNFAHEKIDGKVIARLDPGKQAKLRQQLIERGQLASQAISYEGFTAHFGVVPVTDAMKRGLDRIHEGFARAKKQLVDMKKKGLAEKVSAFEATYTKAFLERERLPQAIQLAQRARENGWQVLLFSETSSEDLFRREVGQGEEPSTYQQLDMAMGGQLARIIPAFPDVYDELRSQFGSQIVDFSGRGNTMAERERAKSAFLAGESPMLYTTYAAGGIGVSLHDADYPDRGIKGGDKPRVAIFLGPPYSGVLLEQAMGRTWRFGVKSDTHAVFLATDSEPDVRLMQTKVGPRMRALRASVLGERDSLANVMASYNDEEKALSRQQALAYQEGNEEQVDARSFTVRSRTRQVGINDWSQINFPPADTAKNRGMRYGETVPGGDWSTLYQAKFGLQPPESAGEIVGGETVDAIGNGLASGVGVPAGESVNELDPADRDSVVGAAAAVATDAVRVPVERDTKASARQSMQSQMKLPGEKYKWILTYPEKGRAVGVWKYTGDPTEIPRSIETGNPEDQPNKNLRTWYGGMVFTQEQGIFSIAKQAGAPEAGAQINRLQRGYTADRDVHFADFAIELHKIFQDAGIRERDNRLMNEVWDVKEGRRASDNPKVNQAVDGLTRWFDRIHDAEADHGVKLKTPGGDFLTYRQIGKDPNYMPHRIDWEAKVQDPLTGEVHTLRDVMKETFAEASRRRIIDSIAQERGYTYDQVVDYLRAYSPNTPVLGHIHRARTINFPFIKKDWKTLNAYALQAADAIAIAKNFGQDREILDREIAKVPSENGRRTIKNMFDGLLEPQEWNDWTSRAYNAAIAFEAATKMTFSAAKVPYHALLIPLGLKGRVRPVIHAAVRMGLHPKDTLENAAYAGAIAHQINAADVIAERDSQGITHEIFKKTAFNAFYKLVRALASESSRVWMEQYAMHELTKGNKDEARRVLRDVMLIGDVAIDQAIQNGRFAPDDLKRGQTAFTNLTTWSNSPLQMPGWARLHMERNESTSSVSFKRAVRLTYALQSFSLKATSLLREQLWDEVMKHHNYKPLAYAMVAMPVIGQMLSGTNAGVSAFVHRGVEGLEGKKHTDDRWDRWLKEQLETFHRPDAVKFLKWYVDGITLSVGWDRVRRYADLSLNMIEGKRPGVNPQDAKSARKAARSAWNYLKDDEIEEFFGPFWGEILHLYEAGKQVGTIAMGETGTKKQKEKKMESAGERYVNEVVPITEQIPQLRPPPTARR